MNRLFSAHARRRGLVAWAWINTLVLLSSGCAVSTPEEPPRTEVAKDLPSGAALRQEVKRALSVFPDARVLGSEQGVPFFVRGTLGQGLRSTADQQRVVEDTAHARLLGSIAPLFALSREQLALKSQQVDEEGHHHLRYQQVQAGLPVIGGELLVHADAAGRVYAANGSARGGPTEPLQPTLGAEAARSLALARSTAPLKAEQAPRLVYFLAEHAETLALAWEVLVQGEEGALPVMERVYIGAHRGQVLAVEPLIHSALYRTVYDAQGLGDYQDFTYLPGTLMRYEYRAPSANSLVNENYDLLAVAYNCYARYFNRNSYDNQGGEIKSSVHFGGRPNAFWVPGPNQLAFSNGDGKDFGPYGSNQDVVIHEFTHGVTQFASGLAYIVGSESAALNESVSDIFAAFCASEVNGVWEMNKRVWDFADGLKIGVESNLPLRYMDTPQFDGMSKDYYPEWLSGNFAHYNAGISNLAFKLLSTGGGHPRNKTPTISVAGIGIEKAGRIFYKANTTFFTSSTTLLQARVATQQAAAALNYDMATQQAVKDAWLAVGVGSGIEGSVEEVSSTVGLRGWAYDRHSPGETLTLRYSIWSPVDNTSASFTDLTSQLRTDVNNAYGLPASSTHGFQWPIPAQYYDGAYHRLVVYGVDVQGVQDEVIRDQSFKFPGAEGHVDEVSSSTGRVRGWALDLQSPATSISVRYVISNPYDSSTPPYEGIVPTDQTRSDVNSAYGATGNHGFSFLIPSQFKDGQRYDIALFALDAQGLHNPLLDNGPYSFQMRPSCASPTPCTAMATAAPKATPC